MNNGTEMSLPAIVMRLSTSWYWLGEAVVAAFPPLTVEAVVEAVPLELVELLPDAVEGVVADVGLMFW